MEKDISRSKDIISELTQQETDLLNKAVNYINTKTNEATRSLIEIGKFLIQELYGGDIEKVEERASRKGLSLRKVAEHDDINLTYRSLSNAVRLAVQERRYFSHNGTFSDLSESHKLALLSVPDSALKLQFAKDVIEKKLSVRKLKAQLVEKGVLIPRGRKPGALEKSSASKLLKILLPLETFEDSTLSELNPSEISEVEKASLLRAIASVREKADQLIALLS